MYLANVRMDSIQYLLISAQGALLDHVTTNLRCVSVDLINNTIYWNCVFDYLASEDEIEYLRVASTEVIADYNSAIYSLREEYKIISYPEHYIALKHLIFRRFKAKIDSNDE